MPRSAHLSAVCALALAMGFSLAVHGQDSTTPSLGDVARQAQAQRDKDKAKDAGKPPAKKVFTNDDLSSGSGSGASATSLGPGHSAQPASSGAPGKPDATTASSSPADQLAQVAALLDRLGSLDRATLAKNVQGSDADFPGRDKAEDTLFAAKQLFVAQEREIMSAANQLEASSKDAPGEQNPNDPRAKAGNIEINQLMQEAQQSSAAFQAAVAEFKQAAATGQSAAH